MRLTINSKANQNFIKDLSNRWQMTEKETLDYLLNQVRIKGLNTFSNQPQTLPAYDTSILENQQQKMGFYQHSTSEELVSDDPMISRLIAAGLELDF